MSQDESMVGHGESMAAAVSFAGATLPLRGGDGGAPRGRQGWVKPLGWALAVLAVLAVLTLAALKMSSGSMGQIAGPDSPAIARMHAQAAARSVAAHLPAVSRRVAGEARIGDPIKLEPIVYTVHTGGSLDDVARVFGMPRALLERLNPQVSPTTFLGPGRQVKVYERGLARLGDEEQDPLAYPEVRVPMMDGPGRRVRRRSVSWGTSLTVHHLDKALKAYGAAYPEGPVIIVSDMSRRGGGRLKPHNTHREGRDVDLSYVPVPKHDNGGFLKMKPGIFDVERNWVFLDALLSSGEVKLILMDWRVQKMLVEYAREQGVDAQRLRTLFQYPRERDEEVGVVRHWDGHRDHMHVRFACPEGMERCD